MSEFTVADLRPVDLFDDLDDDELAAWAAVAKPYHHAAGTVISEQGSEPEGVILLLEGTGMAVIMRATGTGG